MKRSLLFFLLLFVLSLGTLTAQQHFTVQVGAFVDVQSRDFDAIRSLGFVYADKVGGNLYHVFLGGYDQRSQAESVANSLRQRGYGNAQVLEKSLADGRNVTVIQLATRDTRKAIDWEKLEQAGDLYALVDGQTIKILKGVYTNTDAAKQALPAIRKLGYNDAFIKTVNSEQLIPVTTFETGIKKPLIPLELNAQAPPATAQPVGGVTIITPPPSDEPVATYSDTGDRILTPRSPAASIPAGPTVTTPTTSTVTTAVTSKAAALPKIRAKVKRRSALELQKVLKAAGHYTGSLDGYYGPGTAGAYTAMLQNNRTLREYQLLSQQAELRTDAGQTDRLQSAINNLPTDPSARLTMESAASPLARGYQAYILFTTLGPSSEVNNLMNQAIRQAYENKKLDKRPNFDYQATYAYQDLDQLIQHLHYLHAAPGINYAVPCWLYERHPRETTRARAAIAGYAGANLKMQACDAFLSWDEVSLLHTIARKLNSDAKLDQARMSAGASRRAQLYLTDQPLNPEEAAAAEEWYQTVWSGLNAWALRDPLHEDLVTALKVAFFQSQVRLEDYFMDQGFKEEKAKELALATLYTITGYHLERFI